MHNIRVEKIHLVNHAGPLRAFIDIALDDLSMKLKGFRIVQCPGQKAWCSVPQYDFVSEAGKRVFVNMIELPADLLAAIRQVSLAAYAAELSKVGGTYV